MIRSQSSISRWILLVPLLVFGACGSPRVSEKINTVPPALKSKTASLSFGGKRRDFLLDGHSAFVIFPQNSATLAEGKRPWIWYAPTLADNELPGRELEWLFPRLLEAGFAIAGVDVGESYGNSAGRKIFSQFHARLVHEFGLSSKACLLPQSRGGLMLYNWAAEHPKNVRCIGGIYTVCNLASYPGTEKAAPAYGMSRDELAAHLAKNNPIDRLAPLAKARIPIFHIHGDADKLVPLEKNSGELIQRYQALGGNGQLMVVPGKGHETAPEFFHSQELLDFFISHSGLKTHFFKKLQLTDKFWSEGANIGDFNHDGAMDVVSGPFWYEGPDFKKRHEYYPATESFKKKNSDGTEMVIPGFEGGLGTNNAYSKNFFAFSYDFNGDDWTDILILGYPSKESWWFENPCGKEGFWQRHVAIDDTGNESPTFVDLTGDGKPEIVCFLQGCIAYAEPDWENSTNKFKIHRISEDKYRAFTHGLGIGDVNGDGRKDILLKDGWCEQPISLANDSVWKFHPVPFAPAPSMGSAQMYADDVNGDGLPDVITSLAAHGYGLAWFEQKRRRNTADEIEFEKHLILNSEGKPNEYGISFSQLHAIDLLDIDGDGLKDIVTGKRFWAHGIRGDVEPNAPAVLYWFQLVRNKDKSVSYVPHLIDDNSGTGTQVVAADVNGDKLPDIIVGNKKGTFVHIHEFRK